MEININKDIREYTEGVFFGLNIRQLICSGLAIASAVAVYFNTKDLVTKDTVTYLCIAVAAPFAAIGFVKYNGMPLEKIIWAFIKDCFLCPRRLSLRANNLYREVTKDFFEKCEKEELRRNAQECEHYPEAG